MSKKDAKTGSKRLSEMGVNSGEGRGEVPIFPEFQAFVHSKKVVVIN